MFILRKIGFYVTLITLVGGTLGVVVMLILGIGMGTGDNVAGAIIGTVFLVIAVLALIGVAIIVVLMIFYQRSIVIPLLFFIIFGLSSIRLSSMETPVLYITMGLAVGPGITLIGYFFKKEPEQIPEPVQHKEESTQTIDL